MAELGNDAPLRGELLRRRTAPLAAVAASCFALVCLTGAVGILLQLPYLSLLGSHFVASVCLGPAFALGTVTLSLLWSRQLGAAPFLALGAVLGAIGVVLGHRLVDGAQLALATAVLGSAAGCLIGGAAAVPFELPWRWARITALTWPVPLVVGWPVLAWLDWQGGGVISLVVPHAVWFAMPAVVVVTLWSAGSLLAAPGRVPSDMRLWRPCWLGLALPLSVLCVMAIAVGSAPGLRLIWLRPVILGSTALALAIWVLVTMVVPTPRAKIAFMATSFIAAAVPSATELIVLATGRVSNDGIVARVLTLVFVSAVAIVLGRRYPRRSVIAGLVVLALFCVLAWPGTTSGLWSTMLIAGLGGAGVAVVAGGFAFALESEGSLRFVSYGFVAALLAGGLVAIPLAWSLVGDLPVTQGAARACSRVLLGLVFSASAPIAAHAYVVGRRIDRRRRRDEERLHAQSDAPIPGSPEPV